MWTSSKQDWWSTAKFAWDAKPKDQIRERICLTDIIFLRYGDSKSGNICVEFEYFQSEGSINYLEVSYSDPDLEKYVEGNQYVLRNVDAYIRNKLLKQEYNYNFF